MANIGWHLMKNDGDTLPNDMFILDKHQIVFQGKIRRRRAS